MAFELGFCTPVLSSSIHASDRFVAEFFLIFSHGSFQRSPVCILADPHPLRSRRRRRYTRHAIRDIREEE